LRWSNLHQPNIGEHSRSIQQLFLGQRHFSSLDCMFAAIKACFRVEQQWRDSRVSELREKLLPKRSASSEC